MHSAPTTSTRPAQGAASLTISLVRLSSTLGGRLVLAFAASLFVALCAHASVPLPFTPVPLTLGDLAVVLVGLLLGPATGAMALGMYLLEGAAGAPVFNPGGPGGLAQILGFTGGYLMAYPFAAALAGAVAGIAPRRYAVSLAAAALASAVIVSSGVIWLAGMHHLALSAAFRLGALPFLPGQAVKVAAAAGIAIALRRTRTP